MFERIKNYPRFLLDLARGLKKIGRYCDKQFLYYLNQKIHERQYNFDLKSTPPPIHNIVVSFTTHKERINYCHYVLDSLYFQTLRPNEVRLYLSKNEYTFLPPVLERFMPWLKIIEVDDLRSFKKFIPALRGARENELIISLDDDFLYPSDLIFSLYGLYTKKKQQGVSGLFSYCGFDCLDEKDSLYSGHAGLGVLWDPIFFNEKNFPYFFDEKIIQALETSNDDAWIGIFCQKNDIKRFACREYYSAIENFIPLPSSDMHALTWNYRSSLHIDSDTNKRITLEINKHFDKSV